jgi:hypothetical protein
MAGFDRLATDPAKRALGGAEEPVWSDERTIVSVESLGGMTCMCLPWLDVFTLHHRELTQCVVVNSHKSQGEESTDTWQIS